MSRMMLHGLGDCTPSLHCGCLAPRQPAAQALAQALAAHQPRCYGTPGYWATATSEIPPDIIASLRAAGWALVPLVDFPSQSCDACGLEHPGAECQQPDLFEEPA